MKRAIVEKGEIEEILRGALVCRLGLCCRGRPYVVPLAFGYEDGALYFHSGRAGRKIDMLKANERVCFEVDTGCEIVPGEKGCSWGMKYASVIGFGRASFLEGAAEKRKGLAVLMAHYGEGEFTFADEAVRAVVVIKVDIESMTGKSNLGNPLQE